MPRNSSGIYTLPLPPVIPNTLIEAEYENVTSDDIGNALTESLDRAGRGGMTGPLRVTDGTLTAPGFSWNGETNSGLWRESTGVINMSVLTEKVMSWSTTGMTMFKPLKFASAEGASISLTENIQPITLKGNEPAIVWYDTVGLVNRAIIQRNAAGFLSINGEEALGIYFQTPSSAFRFTHPNVEPITNGSINMGSDALRWAAGWFNQTVTIGTGTNGFTAFDGGGLRIGRGQQWASGATEMWTANALGIGTTADAAISFRANNEMRMTISPVRIDAAIPFNCYGGVVGGAPSLAAYAATNSAAVHGAIFVNGSAGSAGEQIWVDFATPTSGEPNTYSLGKKIACVTTSGGFPQFVTSWVTTQFQGWNGTTLTLNHMDGVYGFANPIVNGSDERRKSNWVDLGLNFVDRLADVKMGVYDYAGSDVVNRQVGVGAQSLREVLPEAITEDHEGWLSVNYGGAALAACVALAREIKALKAKLGV